MRPDKERCKGMIAIDGPASSGKTTVAQRVARALGYLFLDTGAMYRAVTLAALQSGVRADDEEAVSRLAQQVKIDIRPPSVADGRLYDVLLNGRDITWAIRRPEVDSRVSRVSAYAGVRQAMTRLQREIGLRGRVVMAGVTSAPWCCRRRILKYTWTPASKSAPAGATGNCRRVVRKCASRRSWSR